MGIDIGTLRAIKACAQLIEKKYPGSCKSLIDAIDKIEDNPVFLLLRAKGIISKWESIKEWYSKQENLTAAESQEMFDISDYAHWDEHYRQQLFKRQGTL